VARPSVIPAVKERLELYLDQRQAEYMSQPEGSRTATLPKTADGKVNVRGIASAIGLRQTQEKYLFEREELSSLINLVAEGQELLPIGSRTSDAADNAIKERLAQQARTAKADAQGAVEARAREAALVEQLEEAQATIADLEATVMRLQAQLDMVHAGLMVRVAE
jgi:hypothetical protein